MQIDPNTRTNFLEGITPAKSSVPPPPKEEAAAAFHDSEALNQAIHDLDEVRTEKIERAMNLVGQVQWPPGDTIRRIAHLLAAKMRRPED